MEIALVVTMELQQSVPPRAALGRLAKLIEAVSVSSGKASLVDLAKAVDEANRVWVDVKYRSDPPATVLVEGLRAIVRVFDLLG